MRAPKFGKWRVDSFGIASSVLFLGAASGLAYTSLELGWFKSGWEFGAWILAVLAFIGVGLGVYTQRTSEGANVYGSAKVASPTEAEAAARGETKAAPLHDEVFPN